MTRKVPMLTLIAFAPCALAADLYGITADGLFVVIDTATGNADPLFHTDAKGGSMAYTPQSAVFAIIEGDTDPGSIILVNLDGTVSDAGPVTGLPPGEQKTGSIGYSGAADDLFVTFGPTGTFLENRIARLGLDAVVTQVSPDLGLGDNDGVVWDAANTRTLVHDYNANDGLPRVASVDDIFGTPTFTTVAEPPSRGDVGDSAVDPQTGRLYVSGFDAAGGFLVEVLQNSYAEIGPYNAGSQVVGIAFGPPAPCNPADLTLPRGLLDLADITAFTSGFLFGAPASDLDNNGLFDLADVNAFVSAFLAGCP